jgi:hypothetical protein
MPMYVWCSVCKQKDPKTGQLEGLSFEFNLCEAVATGEQVSFASNVCASGLSSGNPAFLLCCWGDVCCVVLLCLNFDVMYNWFII